MKKWVCKECRYIMTQHGRFKFIYYCNNNLCKFYKIFVTKKKDDKMNGDKKFKEIYDKFGGSYGAIIEEYLRVLNELEKCRQLLDEQISRK